MNVRKRSLPVPNARLKAPIRLGYVGCGFMAQHVHLPNFSTLSQCALLAIAERRPQLARAVASRFAVEKVYSSHLELAADAEIDAVAVSANYAQQGEIAADLLKAGQARLYGKTDGRLSLARREDPECREQRRCATHGCIHETV
jgi:hypothetical protein